MPWDIRSQDDWTKKRDSARRTQARARGRKTPDGECGRCGRAIGLAKGNEVLMPHKNLNGAVCAGGGTFPLRQLKVDATIRRGVALTRRNRPGAESTGHTETSRGAQGAKGSDDDPGATGSARGRLTASQGERED